MRVRCSAGMRADESIEWAVNYLAPLAGRGSTAASIFHESRAHGRQFTQRGSSFSERGGDSPASGNMTSPGMGWNAFRRSTLRLFEREAIFLDQRLEYCGRRRALCLPYFLRSTTRLSRVRKP